MLNYLNALVTIPPQNKDRKVVSELPEQEIKLVKKGLFYYLIKAIAFPFILLGKLIKFAFKNLADFSREIYEYKKQKKNTKTLNKAISIDKFDGEII